MLFRSPGAPLSPGDRDGRAQDDLTTPNRKETTASHQNERQSVSGTDRLQIVPQDRGGRLRSWEMAVSGALGYDPFTASTYQLVMDVGWVMAVPTTTHQAPASTASAASCGQWTLPSQTTGRPGNSATAWRMRSRSGPWPAAWSMAAPGRSEERRVGKECLF